MFQIAICDDNPAICLEMEKIVLEYRKYKSIEMEVEIFESGEKLIYFIEHEHPFDLIFLDIELGEISGVDVGKIIRNTFHDHISKIVFISGANGYDRELFDMQPFNFLQKPMIKENIIKCIELALEMMSIMNISFQYKAGRRRERVEYKHILYFESVLKKIKIVRFDGEDEFYGSLEKIKEDLPKMFIAPHRSFIINFSNVKCIQKDSVIMMNGTQVPISQRNLKNLRTLQLEIEKEKRDARL